MITTVNSTKAGRKIVGGWELDAPPPGRGVSWWNPAPSQAAARQHPAFGGSLPLAELNTNGCKARGPNSPLFHPQLPKRSIPVWLPLETHQKSYRWRTGALARHTGSFLVRPAFSLSRAAALAWSHHTELLQIPMGATLSSTCMLVCVCLRSFFCLEWLWFPWLLGSFLSFNTQHRCHCVWNPSRSLLVTDLIISSLISPLPQDKPLSLSQRI